MWYHRSGIPTHTRKIFRRETIRHRKRTKAARCHSCRLAERTIFPPKMDYHTLLQLTGFLTQDPVQVEEQFRRMCFNVYAENRDDHARNFSFICREGVWMLSPAYDLTNDNTLGEHATTANGKGLPSDEDLIAVGTSIRISRSRCLEIISEVKPIAKDLLQQIK